MANRWGNSGNTERLFFWAPNSLQMVTAPMKLKEQQTGSKQEKEYVKAVYCHPAYLT